MKMLKTIALISFILVFYPIFALPLAFKEWAVAVLALVIFVLSSTLIYIEKSKSLEPSHQDANFNEEE